MSEDVFTIEKINKFLEEVAAEKIRLEKRGWSVKDSSFIMRAIRIIKQLMNNA